MKTFRISFVVVAALLAIICVASFLSPSTSSRANQSTPSKLGPTIQYPDGVPAVTPSHKVTTVINQTTVNVSSNDVTQFVTSFGMPRCLVVNNGHATVLKILLITAQQASILMQGEDIGRPASALVYYVQVQGPFETDGLSAPASSIISTPTQAPTTTYKTWSVGEMVFDPSTGNLLVWGFPPQ